MVEVLKPKESDVGHVTFLIVKVLAGLYPLNHKLVIVINLDI